LSVAQPAHAGTLQYTLSGVTFFDGATANGYFDYNAANNVVGDYHITTTNGTSDGIAGITYTPADATYGDLPISFGATGTIAIAFYGGPGGNNSGRLVLGTDTTTPAGGLIPLTPGVIDVYGYPIGSQEMAPQNGVYGTTRLVSGGNLIVSPTAVPEASSIVAFGLFLVAGGTVALRRRKRAAS
jgi:hypothetical protein